MILDNYISIIIAYFIGCFPSAYIVVKYLFKKDIRDHGTGNVGAMNTYDVTQSHFAGFLVFFLDFIKALFAVYLVNNILGYDFYSTSLAVAFVMIGHNYNLLLKFNGGRGLASAAGALLLINPPAIMLWLLMYFTSLHVIKKDVHLATVVASVCGPAIMWGAPDYAISNIAFISVSDPTQFKLLYTIMGALIIFKNIKPLRKALDLKDPEESN